MCDNVYKEYFVENYGYLKVYSDGSIIGKGGGYLKQNINRDGYYYIKICIKTLNNIKKFKEFRVHRLVAICFIDNPYDKCCVNHIDGNKLNNNVNNLEWVTPKENVHHAINMNLFNPVGENNKNAKLTYDQVENIRKEYSNGSVINHIAKRYNVTWNTIHNIISNKNWK